MPGWECPICHRRFARPRQAHECSPAMTIDDYFSTGPPFERPIFESVLEVVSSFGLVHVEPVSVGIFIKKTGSFLELRPKTKWVALSFPLGRTVQHSQISRKPIVAGSCVYHYVNLSTPGDLTPEVESWLAESYAIAD